MINISKLYCGLAGQSDKLRYSRDDTAGPVVVFNCTNRCNLRCLHCYSFSDSTCTESQLTTADAKRLLEQLAEINCPVVLFSGGEPCLREDLFELLTEARRLNLRAVLSTNGTLIDSAVATKLADVGVSYVGVSIDGPEDFHDEFRKVKGCFKAAVTGIRNCQAVGLRTGLRFTITKANGQYVPFIFELAAEINVRRVCFYHLIRSGRAAELTEPATVEQTRAAVDLIIEKTAEAVKAGAVDEVLTVDNHADGPYLLMKLQQLDAAGFEDAKKLLLANGGNKVGEKIAAVGPDGSVYADQFWRNYTLGNIKDKTFSDIWYNANEPVLAKLRNKTGFAAEKCTRCKWFDYCKGNYRFLGSDAAEEDWQLEPGCYLTDEEIRT